MILSTDMSKITILIKGIKRIKRIKILAYQIKLVDSVAVEKKGRYRYKSSC